MNKFLVYSLSIVAMFSVANSRPENCGASALGLTYCGMKWEDYFDGSEDYGEVRRNRGGGTRGGSNDGGSYGRGVQYGAQSGNNFEGSRNGFTAGGQGYGLSGSGYDEGSNGGYISSFQNTNQVGTISNYGTTDQGYGYAQGSNGGYSSSFPNSNQGSAFRQGDSGIGEGQTNAVLGQGSDYLQSSNGDYSSSFATSGQVSAFDGKICRGYASSGQGSSSETIIRSQKPAFAKDIVWNGDSGISSSYYPTEGQENSYFDSNGDNIDEYAATGQSEGQRNAAVGQGSAYLQSSNGDYSSTVAIVQ